MLKKEGYVRVGAMVPELKVANVTFNSEEIVKQIEESEKLGINIVTLPELAITAYTCADLFNQDVLIKKSLEGLKYILNKTKNADIISIIGMPLEVGNQLFNVAVVINKGNILGVIPKTYLPNYNEFYEKRWFTSGKGIINQEIDILNQKVPFGVDLLFEDIENKEICFAVEICEDLWSLCPPSNNYALNGATIIFNLSASNELIGKYEYRRELVTSQSARCVCAYIYSSSGVNESTTDLVFSGHSLITENGILLSENERFNFNSNIIMYDIDVKKLINDRRKNTSFTSIIKNSEYRKIFLNIKDKNNSLIREYDKYPFVPSNETRRNERCKEIINIQASALAKRIKHTKIKKTVIGISGGLDSTLAFLVIIEAYKKLGINNRNIIAVTMPGFGTTNRTYQNALKLIKSYEASLREIDIKDSCLQHFKDINHDSNIHDVTYENAQARERTQILMDIANKENALVIGTGDLSELALGWCTYNGDHMSMYAVNSSIPKTLVRYLVKWIADSTKVKKRKDVIYDILDTPISPELLPPDASGNIKQKTESTIGPYILHDFFLYHFLRYGASPSKILMIAKHTFNDYYDEEIIKHWLTIFIKKFFINQFKRSCLPDGPKVGSISLSPRGDLRMPSDAEMEDWLKDLEKR